MANKARGETEIDIPSIGKRTLCLTMAAMAEMEDAFEVDNLQQAMEKMGAAPSSRNLAIVLHALLIDKHEDEFTIEDIRRWKLSPFIIREAMSAMNAANADEEEGNDEAASK